MMISKEENHLLCIDGLKGIGAFIIAFIWHYQHFAPQEGSPFNNIFKVSYVIGWSMVDLFFLLSGLGMMIGYGKRIFNKDISFKDYIIKRLKKLYPLFIISTIAVFTFEFIYMHKTGTTFTYGNYDIYHVIQNILFLQYGVLGTEYSLNAPSWCIPICLLCYCMFYFIMFRTKEYQNVIYKFIFTAIIGAALIATEWKWPLLNASVGRGIAGFSVGVLLAMIYEKRDCFKSKKLGNWCLAFILLCYLVLRFKSTDHLGNVTLSMILGIGPMMIISTIFVPWLNIFMRNPIFKCLGTISWEIYLFHFPVQCIIKIIDEYMQLNINYSNKRMWIIYVIITICISAIHHFLLAKRANKYILNIFKLANTD